MKKAAFLFLSSLCIGGLLPLFSQQKIDANRDSQINLLEGLNYSVVLPQSWMELNDPEDLSQIKNTFGDVEDKMNFKYYSDPQKNNLFMVAESLTPRRISSFEDFFVEKSAVKEVYNEHEYVTITEISNNFTTKIACIESNYNLVFFIFVLAGTNTNIVDQVLSSTKFTTPEPNYFNELHYSMLLPPAWQEINNSEFFSFFEKGIEDMIKKISIKEYNLKYFSDPVEENFLFIVEFPLPLGYSLEKRMREQEVVKTIYNGNEFYTITEDSGNRILKAASIQYNHFLYLFMFVLDDANEGTADNIFSSIIFNDTKIVEKIPGFFTGLWHGIRWPFVYFLNYFLKNKIVPFYESGAIGYKIGYYSIFVIAIISAISSFLSRIFNGIRR